MTNSRTRKVRLEEDYRLLNKLVQNSPYISILGKTGNPPMKYVIGFTCKGVKSIEGSEVQYSEHHELEIILVPDYPMSKPQIYFKTKLYHPNVSSSGIVCIGDEWISSARFLDNLVIFCARMIRYEGFNLTVTEDAYNKGAYKWAKENMHLLPVDKRPLVNSSYKTKGIKKDITIVNVIEKELTNIRVVNHTCRHSIIPETEFIDFEKLKLWGNPENETLDAVISYQAYDTIMQHANSSYDKEVGGLLIGKVYERIDKFLVHIERAIEDKLGESSAATYSFTHQSWSRLIRIVEEEYTSLRIVGWYHSHPKFGIFYSQVDKKSHQIYFNKPWMVGIVVDPVRYSAGFFINDKKNSNIRKLQGFYEYNDSENKNERIRWKNGE